MPAEASLPATAPVSHFRYLTCEQRQTIFSVPPSLVRRDAVPQDLADVLGATLYTPASHPGLAGHLASALDKGVTSAVLCLEDSVPDEDLAEAETKVLACLDGVARSDAPPRLPLLFVRVRSHHQLVAFTHRLGGAARLLTGYVMPKFTSSNGANWLDALQAASAIAGTRLYGMPVLETGEVLFRERRSRELSALSQLLDHRRGEVLAVRIGGTDLCGLLGLRRTASETIYDLAAVRDCIGDIVNVFSRSESRQVVSGPVWEYFAQKPRIWKPQLRQGLFDRYGRAGVSLRMNLVSEHLDGLIAETLLDQANGLLGKTVIHPSHVRAVNALNVVDYEEYQDACQILGCASGGATASSYGNKMNEAKPHQLWAARVRRRARAFGVYRDGTSFVDVLNA